MAEPSRALSRRTESGLLGVAEPLLRSLGVRAIPLPELRAKYETEASRYVEVDGTRVHYRIEGQGPPLLLLHGVLSQLQTWDGWVERLREHFTLVRLDLPGFGLTGPLATGTYAPDYALDFFDRTRAALGFERFSLAGSSLGGFIGWYYAVQHPERIERLVLLDPVSYPQNLPWLMRFSGSPLVAPVARRMVPRAAISLGVWQVYGDRSQITPEIVDRYHELLLREGNREAMVEYFQAAARHFSLRAAEPLSHHIARLRTPTLLMWGESDRWLPVSHVDRWRADVPGLQALTYPGVGHVPMEEIPERSAADALAFLRG